MANGDGKTIEVAVGGVLLVVGKLKWKQYKRLKSQVIQTLANDAQALLAAVGAGADGDFSTVAQIISEAVGDLDILYAEGCLVDPPEGFKIGELDFSDISRLVGAATTLNPVDEVVNHEKNSASGGLILSLFKTVSSLSGSGRVGGSILNQFLPASTGGPNGT